jgi:hypothetical protein
VRFAGLESRGAQVGATIRVIGIGTPGPTIQSVPTQPDVRVST